MTACYLFEIFNLNLKESFYFHFFFNSGGIKAEQKFMRQVKLKRFLVKRIEVFCHINHSTVNVQNVYRSTVSTYHPSFFSHCIIMCHSHGAYKITSRLGKNCTALVASLSSALNVFAD